MTTPHYLTHLSPQEAVSLATELLTYAEAHGADVCWYITNERTWEDLSPEQRHNIGIDKAERLLADYLRRQADRLDPKDRVQS